MFTAQIPISEMKDQNQDRIHNRFHRIWLKMFEEKHLNTTKQLYIWIQLKQDTTHEPECSHVEHFCETN